MVMPVLAVAALDYPDYSPFLVGLAIGGYGLTQAALQIPMGMLSDRWGRKPVILLGLAMFAGGSLIAALADSLSLMVVGRILQGAGAIAGAIMALATDVSREAQRAKVMAIIGIAIGFSFYLAVLVGPLIAQYGGLSGIFALTGILALCCMPLIYWVVPAAPPSASADVLPRPGQVARLLRAPQLWRLNVSVLLLHMMITLLFVNLPVTLLALDFTLDVQWQLYLPVLVASIVGLTGLMAWGRGRTLRKIVLSAAGLMALGFVGLGLEPASLAWVVVALVLFFTGFNYLEASFPALVSTLAPAGQKGTAMGIYASFQFFGAFAGGMLAGLVAELSSPTGAYLTGAAVAVAWLALLSGLNNMHILKRVALPFSGPPARSGELDAALGQIPGVQETAVSAEDGMVYLKVNQHFDQAQAHQVIALHTSQARA